MPTIKLDDIEMHYKEQGHGENAIVFIHGGGSSSGSWKDLGVWDILPEDYHAYAFDMRRHGRLINVRDNYNYSQLANDIYRAANKLGLGKFVCVGYSMGGWVAFHIALEYPESLKALIVLGGALPGRREKQWWNASQKENEKLLTAHQGNSQEMKKALEAQLASAFVRPLSHPNIKKFMDRLANATKEQRSATVPGLPLPEAKTDAEMMALLGKITMPTLMINGCRDRADKALRVASAIPGAKIVLFQDESHMIVIESPEKVVAEIVHFVSQLEKTN
jgi:pimeloyl-ACP methyl ester carboxylesterase